jgi:hypothetical protein
MEKCNKKVWGTEEKFKGCQKESKRNEKVRNRLFPCLRWKNAIEWEIFKVVDWVIEIKP